MSRVGASRVRGRLLLAGVLAGITLVGARSVQLQVVEEERWKETAERQHHARSELPARRGAIYDRRGAPLALSHETFRISVAPYELADAARGARRLSEALGITESGLESIAKRERRWVVLPGRYTLQQRDRLANVRGVYAERHLDRYLPQDELVRGVVGVVSGDGRALGGLEQQFDSLLRGKAGHTMLRRGGHGVPRTSSAHPVEAPRDGVDLHLTLDLDLQEIADHALRNAITEHGAKGGDLLITQPHSGDILAAVSRRDGVASSLASFTEPFEPGSTFKPFLAAALLAESGATLEDSVDTEGGRWVAPGGRIVTDIAPHEWLSLRDALRVSSNIGMVKFASRLSPAVQFRYLRDFGFGMPTGVPFPSEAGGRLARPAGWSALTPASLAMGYEVAVTPLQLAMAYGVLANGGLLMKPRLVREVKSDRGEVLSRHEPVRVRRVVSVEVTRQISEALAAVVEDGTGGRAALATFDVAGKTGTARRLGPGGRYLRGRYTSTFVGFFPADQPQLVIMVKLDEPEAPYYGGLVAAPVNRETLHATLAARGGVLEGGKLIRSRGGNWNGLPSRPVERAATSGAEGGSVLFRTRDGIPGRDTDRLAEPVAVPDLVGAPVREAVRKAHELGLWVATEGSGPVQRVAPEAGTEVMVGDTLRLIGGFP